MRWSSWRVSSFTFRSRSFTWSTTWARTRPSYERDVAVRPALRNRWQLQTTRTSSLRLAHAGGCGPTSFDGSTRSIPCDVSDVALPCASSLSSPTDPSSGGSSTTSRAGPRPNAGHHQPREQPAFSPCALDRLRFEPGVDVSPPGHHFRFPTASSLATRFPYRTLVLSSSCPGRRTHPHRPTSCQRTLPPNAGAPLTASPVFTLQKANAYPSIGSCGIDRFDRESVEDAQAPRPRALASATRALSLRCGPGVSECGLPGATGVDASRPRAHLHACKHAQKAGWHKDASLCTITMWGICTSGSVGGPVEQSTGLSRSLLLTRKAQELAARR